MGGGAWVNNVIEFGKTFGYLHVTVKLKFKLTQVKATSKEWLWLRLLQCWRVRPFSHSHYLPWPILQICKEFEKMLPSWITWLVFALYEPHNPWLSTIKINLFNHFAIDFYPNQHCYSNMSVNWILNIYIGIHLKLASSFCHLNWEPD